MNDFGDLRGLIHGAPSLERFHEVLALIERGDGLPGARDRLHYARQSLDASWPDALRACPQSRLADLEDHKVCWAPLVRSLDYEGQRLTPKRFQTLLHSKHLAHITHLDMKACRFSWDDLLQLASVSPFDALSGFAMRKSSSSGTHEKAIKKLFHSPMLSNLAHLSFEGWSGIKPRVYDITASAPFLSTLKSLNLSGCKVSAKRFGSLMSRPELQGLEVFRMSWQTKGARPGRMKVLTEAEHLTQLQEIQMADFSAEELVAFSRAKHLATLRKLHLALHNSLSSDDPVMEDAALVEFSRTPVLTGLNALSLGMNLLKSATLSTLVQAPAMQSLQHLEIRSRSYSNWGLHRPSGEEYEGQIEALAASPLLRRLHTLHLYHLAHDAEALAPLFASDALSFIQDLKIVDRRLNEAHVEAILSSPHLSRLRRLELCDVALTLPQLRDLAAAQSLPAIEMIRLHHLRGIDGAQMQQFDDMIAQGAFPDRRITRAYSGYRIETRHLV